MRVGQTVIWTHRVREHSNTVRTEELRGLVLRTTQYRVTIRVPPEGEPHRIVSVPKENLTPV